MAPLERDTTRPLGSVAQGARPDAALMAECAQAELGPCRCRQMDDGIDQRVRCHQFAKPPRRPIERRKVGSVAKQPHGLPDMMFAKAANRGDANEQKLQAVRPAFNRVSPFKAVETGPLIGRIGTMAKAEIVKGHDIHPLSMGESYLCPVSGFDCDLQRPA